MPTASPPTSRPTTSTAARLAAGAWTAKVRSTLPTTTTEPSTRSKGSRTVRHCPPATVQRLRSRLGARGLAPIVMGALGLLACGSGDPEPANAGGTGGSVATGGSGGGTSIDAAAGGSGGIPSPHDASSESSPEQEAASDGGTACAAGDLLCDPQSSF